MPAFAQTKGACAYCGREFTRAHMARHLGACDKRRVAVTAADAGEGKETTLVHLQVRDDGSGLFWLNLEVDGTATLKQVDDYLRTIWLECCGHLSQFSASGWMSDEIPKSRRVGAVFRPGVELTHIYDFGTESVTLLKFAGERVGKRSTRHPIFLMARNQEPGWTCQTCGERASFFCEECAYEDETGYLCATHRRRHPHFDPSPVKLVNSPRTGMCGYDGPATPPY